MKVEALKLGLQQVLNHQGIRRYGANTLWLFAEQVLRMVAGFLVGAWVARYLGPEKFGLLSYALAFVFIFQGIAKLGLDGIVVRDLVQEPEKRDVYLGTSFWLKLVGGVITFLIIVIILFIQSIFTSNFFSETNIYILIIAFGIIFQSLEVIDFYYQAKVQAKYISIRRIVQLIFSSIIKIFLVLTGADLIWFVLVSLFDIISLSIMGWLIYRSKGLPNFVRYFDMEIGKKLLRDSLPLLLSSIAISIYMRIDQVMIKNMLGDREVGLYSAAMRLVEVWYFIPMIITQSVFPAIVNAKKISEELYYKRLQRLYALMVWIGILIALIVTILSNWIITFLYGQAYVGSAKVLMISIWVIVFVFLGVLQGVFFINNNLQKQKFLITLFCGLINIILNIFLISFFKTYGAAFATLISYALGTLFFPLFFKNTRHFMVMTYRAFYLWRLYK